MTICERLRFSATLAKNFSIGVYYILKVSLNSIAGHQFKKSQNKLKRICCTKVAEYHQNKDLFLLLPRQIYPLLKHEGHRIKMDWWRSAASASLLSKQTSFLTKKKSFIYITSWPQIPLSHSSFHQPFFLFHKSTRYLPLDKIKLQAFQRHWQNTAQQTKIRPNTCHHVKAGQGNTVRRKGSQKKAQESQTSPTATVPLPLLAIP